ncbi:MAG: hypothetical protein HQL67_04845 [Magnetococcales bacterium]|nr:hypothetical protein [Magnetococcales bacterium]
MNMRSIGILLATLVAGFGLVSEGLAFCVQNDSEVSLFARSLDSGKFQVDIPPGEKKCCQKCINPKRDKTALLIVSGYEPVSQNSHPGWQAECRTDTTESGLITVTGSLKKIACQ